MKVLKRFLLIPFVMTVTQADAQIWKKIKKAVEEGVEKTVEKRMERESEETTDKALDQVFEKSDPLQSPSGTASPPRASYDFDYKYTLQFSDDKNTVDIPFLLKSNDNYFGALPPSGSDEDITTVYDQETETSHVFMANNNEKTRMSMKISLKKFADQEIDPEGLSIRPIAGSKKILGYDCKGYEISGQNAGGDPIESTVWLNELPISFGIKSGHMMRNSKLSGLDFGILDGKGLVMEMEHYTYKLDKNGAKKKERRSKLKCIAFGKTAVTVNSNEYSSGLP